MWGPAHPLVWCLVLLCVLSPGDAIHYRCDGTPYLSPPKRVSDRFAIKISGNPENYSPHNKYAVSIEPTHPIASADKFIGFALIAESSVSPLPGELSRKGTFHLIDETVTKFSETCPHMVLQTSSRLKSEIAVHWVAPESGAGCITFRATIVEPGDHWFMHDGALSRTLCEDSAENLDEQPDQVENCCACDEAKYEVTFEGLWSRHTHPKDFPPNGWLTRFSDVIGASHTGEYRFWKYGELASEGLKQVAERGWTRMLESELKSQSENIRTIIKARGISYPNVTGKTFAVFRVDRQHHLMSLVSMIVPSPDWIVGVSGLELCLRNCSWVESKVLNLNPWDIGTDSGVTYTSPDSPTDPPEPIRQITSSYPADEASPFYDPSGEKLRPLARLYITRQRLYEKSCSDDSVGRDEEENAGDCAVGEWTPWTPCSVTCGRGYRYQQRFYIYENHAMMANCDVVLTKKENCHASRYCSGEPQLPFHPDEKPPLANDPRCDVTEWGDWSGCSATCGRHAVKTRSREYRMRGGRKLCGDAQILQETLPCGLDDCEDDGGEEEETCEPQWSDWTPCSVTCGRGVRTRTTRGHSYSTDGTKCSGHPRTEQVECEGELRTCNYSAEDRTDICLLHAAKGDCAMNLERWYFDKGHVECRGFIFTGCKGNGNNFLTKQECEEACSGVVDGLNALYELGAMGVISNAYGLEILTIESTTEPLDVDGALKVNRTRQMAKYGVKLSAVLAYHIPLANNFGTARPDCDPMHPDQSTDSPHFRGIPADSLRNGSYYNYYSTVPEVTEAPDDGTGAVDCKLGRWTRWSRCSVTCGKGIRVKTRKIKVHPRNGGKPCDSPLRRSKPCVKQNCDSTVDDPPASSDESADQQATWGPPDLPAPRRPSDCVMGPWSPWSECSATCGLRASQMRTRNILVHSQTGEPCREDVFQTKLCNLLPCKE